ncbi:MAG: TerB family tellurite resistance protein, partial [Woeseiaceae bacterium]|nr:TerB family tellurite resistance protein [Woeseiaceae bacterium]
MLFILIGALLGAIFGSFPGALVGGVLGYFASVALQRSIIGNLQIAQAQLVDSTFSIMGALCKADGVVDRDEINAVEQMFRMLHLNDEGREQAKAAFTRGKQPGFDLDAAVDEFRRISHGRLPLLQLFLQMQVMAVAADGVVHAAEHEMLVRIARRLNLSEVDV